MAKKQPKESGSHPDELSGADFICVRGDISGKVQTSDPDRPFALVVVAREGESCDRVDPKSLGWLLEQGYIRPREDRQVVDDPA